MIIFSIDENWVKIRVMAFRQTSNQGLRLGANEAHSTSKSLKKEERLQKAKTSELIQLYHSFSNTPFSRF